VPSDAEYTAINAATAGETIKSVFPGLFPAGAPYSTNGIPVAQTIDPITLNYLKLYPKGNVPSSPGTI